MPVPVPVPPECRCCLASTACAAFLKCRCRLSSSASLRIASALPDRLTPCDTSPLVKSTVHDVAAEELLLLLTSKQRSPPLVADDDDDEVDDEVDDNDDDDRDRLHARGVLSGGTPTNRAAKSGDDPGAPAAAALIPTARSLTGRLPPRPRCDRCDALSRGFSMRPSVPLRTG